jgi:outer membrane protein assembly factor BamB
MSDTASSVSPTQVTSSLTTTPSAERRLRIWPGVMIIALMWLGIKVPGLIWPGTFIQFMVIFLSLIVGAAAIAAWWLFASRARWMDRLLILFVCAIGGVVAALLAHPSIGNPMAMIMTALPWAVTAWVVWLVVTPFLSWPIRRAGLALVILLAWSYSTLLRLDGVWGSFTTELAWRWSPTAEDRFLAGLNPNKPAANSQTSGASVGTLTLQPRDWPGFRGPNRDGHLSGVRIATDWKQHPPQQVWRHRVGPGWGSFAVIGNHLYTQEQRGEEEAVVCYDAATGNEIWVHSDPARFQDMQSGPGPRATPTFLEGKVYSFGANGLLNCLNAATGEKLWSRDVKKDADAKVPTWGFASSPLIVNGIVTVYAGGPEGKSVLGYQAATGQVAWSAGEGQLGYSSTQVARLVGTEQLLISTDIGLTALEPTSGQVLWKHDWNTNGQVARITRPAILSDTDLLIGTGMGVGTRRVHVSHDENSWKTEEIWTTRVIAPYFNDLVVYQGNAYGFDGVMLTCVNIEDGKRRWRERGYGNGQALLLEDQGILLVTSEKGDVGLVQASPEFHQLAKMKVFEGKTWNHPVIAHGKLFLRNGEEAVCYELTEEPARLASAK